VSSTDAGTLPNVAASLGTNYDEVDLRLAAARWLSDWPPPKRDSDAKRIARSTGIVRMPARRLVVGRHTEGRRQGRERRPALGAHRHTGRMQEEHNTAQEHPVYTVRLKF
jgi:hypothetical protein